MNGSLIKIAESGFFSDRLVRIGIRNLVRMRLKEELSGSPEEQENRLHRVIAGLRDSPIALDVQSANDQHYELPADFFAKVLGKHLKYSSGYWDSGAKDLDQAESEMLELYAMRAGLADGQEVLDLGCGWGSLSLWAAKKFPSSNFTAVSNSRLQKEFILTTAKELNISNIRVITTDINVLDLDEKFDRIISIEMFEHMRNYGELLSKVSSWLVPEGKLFVHIFCHRNISYPFEKEGESNWMGRYFFTGGLMPSLDTLLFFQEHLVIERRWQVSGINYAKTAGQWLKKLDSDRNNVLEILRGFYGDNEAKIWLQRWRIFFMACEEQFAFRQGSEWMVAHYLFGKP